ncbi:3-hydroxyisobutyrate dehydrogenase [Lipingzhangella halophila]|uniref:3-hydroxyisobutyrate dehydrogenase n=1 Tax=Lipingzhangella halophila TaxID=1783352 RepID=A0A7W7RJB5_9ACTN|nr:NAD(P)-dependent oxidoreductase [Lipingzhangella halophila]MBB4933036.1 3-hydroxyisobutyrate dehydrogenase [Lipingzhangella halophila]
MTSGSEPVRVALCGLGNMGSAIAGRLADTGWPTLVFDLDAERTRQAAEAPGAAAAASVAELATADVVLLSLPTPKASLEVVSELAPRMRADADTVIVETSTVNPPDMTAAGEVCAPHGVGIIDAAILSGVAQMRSGSAALLVGGEERHTRTAAPVLDAISASSRQFGPLGSGMAAKVINNAVAHAVMVVLSEAGALAAATGVSGTALAELLGGADAGLTRPLTHRFVERILRAEYEGGMPTEAARKDSTLVLDLAQQTNVPLFALQSTHTVYELGMAQGLGRYDYSAIATLWEQWTGRPMSETGDGNGGDE